MDRPSTSKPRGVCKYYPTRGGCLNGNSCKFLHGDGATLSPYDQSKACVYYAAGYCRRGEACWFRHDNPSGLATANGEPVPETGEVSEGPNDSEICGICYDKPVTYGLLTGCDHIFCLKCLRDWRDPVGKSADLLVSQNIKKCPFCRSASPFITPSSKLYTNGPEKERITQQYKASMARVPCRYFEVSPPHRRHCPYGSDCFYQHLNSDGTPYTFPHGADHYMPLPHRQSNRASVDFNDFLENFWLSMEDTRDMLEPFADDDAEEDTFDYGQLTESFMNFFSSMWGPRHPPPPPNRARRQGDAPARPSEPQTRDPPAPPRGSTNRRQASTSGDRPTPVADPTTGANQPLPSNPDPIPISVPQHESEVAEPPRVALPPFSSRFSTVLPQSRPNRSETASPDKPDGINPSPSSTVNDPPSTENGPSSSTITASTAPHGDNVTLYFGSIPNTFSNPIVTARPGDSSTLTNLTTGSKPGQQEGDTPGQEAATIHSEPEERPQVPKDTMRRGRSRQAVPGPSNRASRNAESPRQSGPGFVTDGRGRVIWTMDPHRPQVQQQCTPANLPTSP